MFDFIYFIVANIFLRLITVEKSYQDGKITKVNFNGELMLINLINWVSEKEENENKIEAKKKQKENDYRYIERKIEKEIFYAMDTPASWVNERWVKIPLERLYTIPIARNKKFTVLHIRIKDIQKYCKSRHFKFKWKMESDSNNIYHTTYYFRVMPYDVYW